MFFKLLFVQFCSEAILSVPLYYTAETLQKTDIPTLLFHLPENHFAVLHWLLSKTAKILSYRLQAILNQHGSVLIRA